ncbi:MAG: SHOCT domain-containing protein [Tepidisphaeraceae bacterium]
MPKLVPLTNLADGDSSASGVVFVCVFLLIIVLAAAYGVIWARRRLWSTEDYDLPATGFTLGDLKQLHRAGKITDQEFQIAREKVLAAAQATAERESAKQTPPSAR